MSVLGLEKEAMFPTRFNADVPEIDFVELEEYIRICDEIGGISCGKLTQARVQKLMLEENICPFKSTQVVNYLDKKLGPKWVWFGLRQEDVDHLGGWIIHTPDARDVEIVKTQYLSPIPYPVLVTIGKIKKAAPGAHFYVSSLPKPKGDPFLLVTAQAMTNFYVECWDEPSFRRE